MGFRIDGDYLNILRLSDDTVLLNQPGENLESMINEFQGNSEGNVEGKHGEDKDNV